MHKGLVSSIKTFCVLITGLFLLAGCGGSGSASTVAATGSSGASAPATGNSTGSIPSSGSSGASASATGSSTGSTPSSGSSTSTSGTSAGSGGSTPPPTGSTAPTGSATVSWSAPTTNTDGSALTDLAGYHIYYGTSATALTQTVNISSAATTSYVLQSLASGTWYFAVSAVTNAGIESARSGVVSKTIG